MTEDGYIGALYESVVQTIWGHFPKRDGYISPIIVNRVLRMFLADPRLRSVLEEAGRITRTVDMYHYRKGEWDFVEAPSDT